jgi:predicted membrane channel-forming protein YqfA (hemolysin III family)
MEIYKNINEKLDKDNLKELDEGPAHSLSGGPNGDWADLYGVALQQRSDSSRILDEEIKEELDDLKESKDELKESKDNLKELEEKKEWSESLFKLNNKDIVPEYLKDYYITSYNIGSNHRECIKNLFKFHHESVNVWTMIFSNLSVLLIIIYVFMRYQFSISYSFIFIIHLLSYTIHTPFSVGYHTFNTINEEEHLKWRKYDVYGIFLRGIISSFVLSFVTYNNFKYTLLNTSFTILIVYYSFLKFKEQEKSKTLDKKEQGILIGIILLSGNIPFFYRIYNSIKNKKYDFMFKYILYGLILSYLLLSAYVFRIPEVFYEPGKFNKIGTSHNIMHLGVIVYSVFETLYVYLSLKQGNLIKSFK